MMTKTMKQMVWLALALALMVGIVMGVLCHETSLSYVRGTQLSGEDIYGVDRKENDFVFFHTDLEGNLLGKITHPTIVDEADYTFDGVIQDGEKIYTLGRVADVISGDILAETLYVCDFDKGELIPYYDLPVNDPLQNTNLGVTVHNTRVYTFQTDYTGKLATATLYSAMAGQTLSPVTQFSFDVGIGFTDFYVSPSETILFTTPTGRAYILGTDGEPTQCFPMSGTATIAHMATNNSEVVHFITNDGGIHILDLESPDSTTHFLTLDYATDPSIETKAYAYNEENSILLVTQRSKVSYYGIEVGGESSFASLRTDRETQMKFFALGLFGTILVEIIIYALFRLFYFLLGGKIPIVTKLLAVFLPILVVSLVAMNMVVTNFFTNQLVDNQFKQLFLLTSQYTATLNTNYIEGIDLDAPHDDIYFYQIRSALNVLPDSGTILTEDSDGQDVYHSTYFWLYKMEKGQLRSLVCEQDYLDVSIEQRYPEDVSALYYQAVESKTAIRTTILDSYGEWTVLLTPVLNEEGEVVALVEAGDTASTLDYAVAEGVAELSRVNLIVMIVLAILLSGVIALSLHPLKMLKKRVEEIADGTLGVQTKVQGHDEVAEISRVFNTMSHNVAYRDNEIRMTSDGYSRFVPAEVFQLLDKRSVIDVKLADQTSVEATVLSCAVSSFDEMARSMRSKEMFTLINEVLERLVPTIEGSGGLVDRFDRAGLLAIYTQTSNGAPDAAIALYRGLRTAKLASAQGQPLDFHAVISSGAAMIGIVGAKERLEAMTISEHTNFTKFLRPLAISHGAHILITASAMERIPDFANRYHARILGYVRMETLEQVERIYDIYDGADEVTFALKEETKPLFEKGVELFCSGNFYDARQLFIEVLKRHREDKAAQKYLYLCDEAFRRESNENHDVCIATY